MTKTFQSITSIFTIIFFGMFFLSLLVVEPPSGNTFSYDVSSSLYDINQKKAIQSSVGSSVRVASLDPITGNISSLSGTYFVFEGRFYVLTSAHGIIGACEGIFAFHFKDYSSCLRIAKIDVENDYAIFEVNEIPTRTAVRIPKQLPNLKKSYNILDKTYYTGYPNSIGPTTWAGTISGFSGDYVIMQSFAWSGASGSGVFDERGKLIGIIMAIDIGTTEFGFQILDNSVIVVPVWQIDFGSITE